MQNSQVSKKPNYFDYLEKFFEIPHSSSGSLTAYNINSPYTIYPDIQQFINSEIKKQLAPVLDTQNALINLSAENALQIDSVKEELNNLTKIYSENYQLKKKIKNINSLHTIEKLSQNWNGNNAEPFSESIINQALGIINSSSLKFQPELFPTGRQSIQLEYEKSNGNYLEIEIFADHFSAYSEISSEIAEYESIQFEQIFRLINDFHSRF